GIVAASGTGLQEVACQLDRLGVGVRHAIGTGGRDLHEAVGGATFLAAIAALARDPGTRVIVALSKPPAPAVRQRVLDALAACGKPAVVHFLGDPTQPCPTLAATARAAAWLAGAAGSSAPGDEPARPQAAGPAAGTPSAALLAAETPARYGGDNPLHREAQLAAQALLARARQLAAPLRPEQRWVRGLYGGGTLCYESQLLIGDLAVPVASNAPLPGRAPYRPGDPAPEAHLLLDLGADEFTAGRLHPMLDPEVRLRYLATAARDPRVAVVLMDVVLGYGAHPNPAEELAPAVVAARAAAAGAGRHLVVIASLCGTPADPQGFEDQARRLEAAGAVVLGSHAEAALLAGTVAALAAGRAVEPAALTRWLIPRLPARTGWDHPPAAAWDAPDGDGRGGREDHGGPRRPAGAGDPAAAPDPGGRSTAPGSGSDPVARLLSGVVAVNAGVGLFAESLARQGVPVVPLDWRPPAGGNPRVLDALRRLRG
ncbi:MAG TPA: protein FdrA, partial [Thermaerobacter sp.]